MMSLVVKRLPPNFIVPRFVSGNSCLPPLTNYKLTLPLRDYQIA